MTIEEIQDLAYKAYKDRKKYIKKLVAALEEKQVPNLAKMCGARVERWVAATHLCGSDGDLFALDELARKSIILHGGTDQ